MEGVESPNSCVVVTIGLDEILSTLVVDAKMLHLPMVEVSQFRVIFD